MRHRVSSNPEKLAAELNSDLARSAGLTFAARGSHRLKGVPGEWALHVAVIDAAPGP